MKSAKHFSYLWFIPLVALGFLVAVFDWRLSRPLPSALPSAEPVEAETDILPQVQDEYEISWSNPRYETDLNLQPYVFKVEVLLVNKNFPGKLQMVVNCDLNNATGMGVSFEGETAMIFLEPGQKVTACHYSPTGVYDPNLAVEVRF